MDTTQLNKPWNQIGQHHLHVLQYSDFCTNLTFYQSNSSNPVFFLKLKIPYHERTVVQSSVEIESVSQLELSAQTIKAWVVLMTKIFFPASFGDLKSDIKVSTRLIPSEACR